jgi:hypothetical protein
VRAFPVCHTHAMEISALAHRYKHHRFPAEIISHGVWLYYRLHLSYRDVQELLFERGIAVTHEAHGAELGRGYSLMPPVVRNYCLSALLADQRASHHTAHTRRSAGHQSSEEQQ